MVVLVTVPFRSGMRGYRIHSQCDVDTIARGSDRSE
jgi:hypothetical protein